MTEDSEQDSDWTIDAKLTRRKRLQETEGSQ